MKKNRASSRKAQAAYLARLDDYELKPEYKLDYRKAKPNRFAGRVRLPRGGARPGSGRKAAPEPLERHTITLYKSHAELLRSIDDSLSSAIRKVLSSYAQGDAQVRRD